MLFIVISEVEHLISGGSNIKTAFTTLVCHGVSVGSYKVTSPPALESSLRVTFSELGILFYLPHRETGNYNYCDLPITKLCSALLLLIYHVVSVVF